MSYKNFKITCEGCGTKFILGNGDDPFCDECCKPGVVQDHPLNIEMKEIPKKQCDICDKWKHTLDFEGHENVDICKSCGNKEKDTLNDLNDLITGKWKKKQPKLITYKGGKKKDKKLRLFSKICYDCDREYKTTSRNAQCCLKCKKNRRKKYNRQYYLKRKSKKQK